ALYIVIVPLLGAFFGKKIPRIILLCVALATAGFYFLCIKEGFSISRGDLLCFACAFVFSAHILTIDHFMEKGADGVLMSDVQFLVAGLLSLPPALLWESPSWSALFTARWNVLYAGALSSGVAYTLQIVGQKHTEPAVASLIMSLESVFAALFGWLILHEALSFRELAGCALVFAAVILAQLPAGERTPS
ncbi:MAG: DMT family transporter, partial [Lachnospiraceae bacterium]|nr:DMT family transporter [Lachnospiraceae bacterium]